MTVRGGRKYNDPRQAHLGATEDPKPHQWAGLVSVVARNAERGAWPPGDAARVLLMLGLDANAARGALRKARRLKMIYACAPTPKNLPRARTGQPEAIATPLKQRRARDGKWVEQEWCVAGLHANTPENRKGRRDRKTTQCRPCTNLRSRAGKTKVDHGN